jgi:hypothetical protein
VNAGGSDYEDRDSVLWSADQPYESGAWGYTGGSAAVSSQDVSGTDDDTLYQHYRVDPSEYRFDLENGDYRLTLHFAEFETDKLNRRMMQVVAEDTVLESSLSVVGEVGQYAALERRYPVRVADGQLNVHFSMSGGKLPPVVSAIQVDRVVEEPMVPEPAIIVDPTSGLVTTEGGGSDTFTVVLGSEPRADVVIGLSSSDTSEGTASVTSLTFDATNWDTPQPVTVTGVDDAEADGDVVYTIVTAPAVSDDPDCNDMDASDVAVTNQDNDQPAGTMHVADLDGLAIGLGNKWQAQITVLVHDAGGAPVADATVTGSWIEGASGTGSCVTDETGTCALTTGEVHKNVPLVTLAVESLSHEWRIYNPAGNSDLDGDSDGAEISVAKP